LQVFEGVQTVASTKAYVTPRFAADFTSDGKADVISLAQDSPGLASYLLLSVNNGDGTFAPGSVVNSGGSTSFTVRDVDGDGKLDLAMTFLGGTTVPYFGDGAGHFAPPPPADATTSCGGGANRTAPPGDFDGDGTPDCAFLSYGGTPGFSDIIFHQGVSYSRYRVETVTTKSFPSQTASPFKSVDLNGDGRADVLLSFSDASKRYVVTLARGNADGTFGLPTNPPPATSLSFKPASSLAGDFNGDGHADVFLVGLQPNGTAMGPVCLATISAGAASIDPSIVEDCATALTTVGSTFVAAVADVNNDGKLDGLFVVLAGDGISSPPHQYRLAVALGDGSGGFTLAPGTGAYGILGTEGVTTAMPVDCNGDGKLDLAVSNRSLDPGVAGPPNAILYGDGTGQFSVTAP